MGSAATWTAGFDRGPGPFYTPDAPMSSARRTSKLRRVFPLCKVGKKAEGSDQRRGTRARSYGHARGVAAATGNGICQSQIATIDETENGRCPRPWPSTAVHVRGFVPLAHAARLGRSSQAERAFGLTEGSRSHQISRARIANADGTHPALRWG